MGDLFNTFTPAAVIAGGMDIVTSPLGIIVTVVGLGPVVARKAFNLLRGAARG